MKGIVLVNMYWKQEDVLFVNIPMNSTAYVSSCFQPHLERLANSGLWSDNLMESTATADA